MTQEFPEGSGSKWPRPDPGAPEADPDAGPDSAGDAADSDVVEGEIMDADSAGSTDADALLSEIFDAEQLEADLAAVESGSQNVSDEITGLTGDLQRVQAEFLNYKRRVERDRDLVRQRAVEIALVELLPVLDDIELAGSHGELTGGFKSVAEKLAAALAKLGLQPFGAVGEPFDPTRHDALMREEAEGVTEPTVVRVLQVGYEMNDRIVRPARVSVAGTD